MIERPRYLERLRTWKDRDMIKVVTGVRRCGKSTLLQMFAEELKAEGVPDSRIIAINLEQLENERLLDYRALHQEVLDRAQPDGMNYVFIDEVQNAPDFQRAVDSLYTRRNLDLYITGSNALLLEGSLATLLSGRYVEVSMLPLSFAEYCSALSDESSLMGAYRSYISRGSFPATVEYPLASLALHDYLEGIINTVLLKDVAQRLNASNTLALSALAEFLFDNIGNLTSIKAISDTLRSAGSAISHNTVAEYISAMTDGFLLYRAKRFDVKGRRILKLNEKYYGVDMGMRRVLLSNQVRDRGRILENIVYLELKRRFGSVYVGTIEGTEVDFVVDGPNGLAYVQVAESVTTDKTLERELASLRKIRDNHPKLLLTLDEGPSVDHEGITQRYALDWLLDDQTAPSC